MPDTSRSNPPSTKESDPPERSFAWWDMFVHPDADPRSDGPGENSERAVLIDYLNDQRLTLQLKCADLDAEQLARRSVPPSDLSLLGLVRHLAGVEQAWTQIRMAGERVPRLYRDESGPSDLGANDLGQHDVGPNDLGPNDLGRTTSARTTSASTSSASTSSPAPSLIRPWSTRLGRPGAVRSHTPTRTSPRPMTSARSVPKAIISAVCSST